MIVNVDRAKTLADQTRAKLDQMRKAGGGKGDAAIEKAAQEFEAVFLSQMMEHMFAEVDLTPGQESPGDDIYKSLLIDEYSKLMARSGGIGVADHVKREMLRVQENPPADVAAVSEVEGVNQAASATVLEEVE